MKHVVIASIVAIGGALYSHTALPADPATSANPDAAAPTVSASAPARLRPMEYLAQPPNCLQETGTHIAPKNGCVSMANGRTYSRHELDSFGDVTVGGMLSRDPAITIQNHR